jgi:hypothetical protein
MHFPTSETLKRFLSLIGNTLLCLLALTGGVHLLAAFTGEALVTPFRPLQLFRADLIPLRTRNLTTSIQIGDSEEKHWQALKTSREILQAINPDISNWLEQLYRGQRIIWTPRPTLFNWPVIASYDGRFNDFYLGPTFWTLPEGEKAAVIAHEYFHAHQNKIWMFADTIEEALSGQLSQYGSRTEDEAHLYQLYAYRAMGLPPSPIARGYFNQRRLYRFTLSE